MLSKHVEESLSNLFGVDRNILCVELFKPFFVELHEFNIMVFVYELEPVIKSFVMAVNSVNILQKAIENWQRGRNLIIYQKRATEVNTSLHEVVRWKMIASELTRVISTKGWFHGVNSWMGFKFVEKGHTGSSIFGLLVSKAAIIIDEERADVR